MQFRCFESLFNRGLNVMSGGAGGLAARRPAGGLVIALAVVLGMAAAGCGTAVTAGGPGLGELTPADAGPPEPAPPLLAPQSGARTAAEPYIGFPTPTTAAAPATDTTIPVTVEGAGSAPEGGHPPKPRVGMIPREQPYWDYPQCAPGPPWPSDCFPPTRWETPQDLSDCWYPFPDLGAGDFCADSSLDETPRWTSDVSSWTSWCFNQPRGNCTWLLYEMKWALDYLGAHPWCVLNEYQDRANAYGSGSRGPRVQDRHGWHNCATVIDPLVADPPAGRSNDAQWLLSETVSLAEQCRIVLPLDVELETRPRLSTGEPDQRFGSDCEAWAEWVENRPRARDVRHCDRSARLAEEWMEHHQATPELYSIVYC